MQKKMTREVFFYLVFGVLTTAVNFITYWLLTRKVGADAFSSNLVAICVSIIFAYVTNSNFVFTTKKDLTLMDSILQVLVFFASRIASLMMDMSLFYFLVTLNGFDDMIVKIIIAVLVVIFNYVSSKFFVFKQ